MLVREDMSPRNIDKDSQTQESDENREIGSPHDRESEGAQPDERAPQKAGVAKNNEEELDSDHEADVTALDDLYAMEGPDA